VAKLKPSRFG